MVPSILTRQSRPGARITSTHRAWAKTAGQLLVRRRLVSAGAGPRQRKTVCGMRSVRSHGVVAVTCALVLAMTGAPGPPRSVATEPSGPAAAGPPGLAPAVVSGGTPLFGVTVDDIGHLGRTVSALAELPDRPATRIYFDVRQPARYYATAVRRISREGAVIGELLDSSDEKAIIVAGFQARPSRTCMRWVPG